MSARKNIWQAAATGDVLALVNCLIKRSKRSGNKRVPVDGLRDNRNWTLLHHATAAASLECIELLLARTNIDVLACCDEGRTVLLLACEKEVPLAIVERLLKTNRSLVNVSNIELVSPLHKAVEKGNLDLVKILVANGAEVDAKNSDELPAIVTAVIAGYLEIVRYLLLGEHAKVPTVNALLRILARSAAYDERKKLDCFKLLFRYKLSKEGREYGPRYRLQDFYLFALLSYQSTSLIPHFVETALLWETNPEIIQFIEYLQKFPEASFPLVNARDYEYAERNRFHMLQLLLAHHEEIRTSYCEHYSTEQMYHNTYLMTELSLFCLVPILEQNNDELFEMVLKFIDWVKVLESFIGVAVLDTLSNIPKELIRRKIKPFSDAKIRARYEVIMGKLVELLPSERPEGLLAGVIEKEQSHKHINYFGPIISYFTDFVPPSDMELCPFWFSLIKQHGPLDLAQLMEGCTMSQFSLVRLARDATRKAVLDAIPRGEQGRHVELVRRLKLLDLPACLLRYLLYLE